MMSTARPASNTSLDTPRPDASHNKPRQLPAREDPCPQASACYPIPDRTSVVIRASSESLASDPPSRRAIICEKCPRPPPAVLTVHDPDGARRECECAGVAEDDPEVAVTAVDGRHLPRLAQVGVGQRSPAQPTARHVLNKAMEKGCAVDDTSLSGPQEGDSTSSRRAGA
jgi:hypothetical protein